MEIVELNINVEDIDDFNDAAGEILTEFCQTLNTPEYTRPLRDDDCVEAREGWSYVWLPKASDLIRNEIYRLYKIGIKYFGDNADIDISSYMFVEP